MELKEFLGAYVQLRFDQKCQTKRHDSHVHIEQALPRRFTYDKVIHRLG